MRFVVRSLLCLDVFQQVQSKLNVMFAAHRAAEGLR
jgi:hypothetical protein